MRKLIIILSLLGISITSTYGQTATDSISMKKVFGGYQFFKGKQALNMNQLAKSLKSNEKAYNQIKSALPTYTLALIIGSVGGAMVGWPLGAAVGGGDPNWTMAGIGAGLIVISIPLSESFNKKAKQAVDTYNGKVETTSIWDKRELKFSVNGNGVRLTMSF